MLVVVLDNLSINPQTPLRNGVLSPWELADDGVGVAAGRRVRTMNQDPMQLDAVKLQQAENGGFSGISEEGIWQEEMPLGWVFLWGTPAGKATLKAMVDGFKAKGLRTRCRQHPMENKKGYLTKAMVVYKLKPVPADVDVATLDPQTVVKLGPAKASKPKASSSKAPKALAAPKVEMPPLTWAGNGAAKIWRAYSQYGCQDVKYNSLPGASQGVSVKLADGVWYFIGSARVAYETAATFADATTRVRAAEFLQERVG
jgi:hypothetical protein